MSAPNSSNSSSGPIVVKIGGSTLGAEDTTLRDVVALAERGARPVVVHGGGALITQWLDRLGVESAFVDGLRATNEEALDVVVGVLRGIVNTRLVAALRELGGDAVGLCGVDGGLIEARREDERLGYVGVVTNIRTAVVESLLAAGAIPVIAPIGLEPPAQPLNINADTVAGELARSLGASRLVFLTDVDGVLDAEGRIIERIDAAQAAKLRADGTLAGGMIPKIEACLRAAETGASAFVANGRQPDTLRALATGASMGTRIGA